MSKRLCIFDGAGKDISDEVELKNSKSNPFGWSQHEVHHLGKRIGWIESGAPDLQEPYTFTITDIAPH